MKFKSTLREMRASNRSQRGAGVLACGFNGRPARSFLRRDAAGTRSRGRPRHQRAFTLAEALVAILFMAIVIPVALGAMRVASMAGEASQRKLVAARIANKVLNELRVENQLQGAQRGLVQENGVAYTWSTGSQFWTGDPVSRMSVATVTVNYSVAGHYCYVRLSALVPPQS